ncbi:MAG TPA: hypothetical protein VIK89_13560, partial [Cytophagaceae bacterium]
FNPDLLLKENDDGTINPNEKVKAKFTIKGSDLNDLIASVSLPPFQIKGLNGFGFYVQDALIDLSDLNNPAGIAFPDDYLPILESYGVRNLWQGFYLREVRVKIPNKYEKRSGTRTALGVQGLIIDHHGVTGNFFGTDLIPIDQGNMGGWAFSLDSLGVRVLANQLRTAGFHGQLQLPIMKEDKSLSYQGLIAPEDNYRFNVIAQEAIDVPLWVAKAELAPGSSIEVNIVSGKFRPKAILHGTMDITASFSGDPNSGAKLAGISFEYLTIQTVKPYVNAQRFSLDEFGGGGKTNMANFPVTLKSVEYVTEGDKGGVAFTIAVNLSKSEDKGFSGEAGLRVLGNIGGTNIKAYSFDALYLDKVKIKIDNDAFKLNGELDIYRSDSVYGKGFKGMIDAWFKPGIGVAVTAQFGNVKGFRYWYVDAQSVLPTGIPVFTGIGVYGFIGGAYYKMRQNTTAMVKVEPGASVLKTDYSEQCGISLSGASYIPDDKIGLGVKAGVIIGTHPKPDPMNADVVFEIQFNIHGGVNLIGFYGDAYVMTPLSKRDGSSPIHASFSMYYDIPNSTLHATMEAYVNAGIVKGTGPQNKAGWMVMHYSPQDWYLYVGTPDNRVSMTLFGAVTVGGYFCAGTQIPGFPDPPAEVAEILGESDLNMMRDENALAGGGGFAFGAFVQANTGPKQFMMFYGQFDVGLGFDIMMKNYGEAVRCAGRTEPLGMKGWYASGQMYGYLQGNIGVRAKVFGEERKVPIIDIGVAAILQAKLPNPTWIQGIIGGRYSALGGLVSGNCKFKLTIGEECQIVGGSVLASIKVIEEITPNQGATEVNVFTSPQAIFNLPVDKTFELQDFDGQTKRFRAKLDQFVLNVNGEILKGSTEANATKDVFAFNTHDILPPEKEIKATVRIVFEEYAGNSWRPVVVDGKVQDELKSILFKTGKAPDYIPHENVAYSYPVINQLNYYKDEHPQGYVTLIKGQPYLFESEGSKWLQLGRVTLSGSGNAMPFAISYDMEKKQVNYSLPQGLQNNSLYKMQFMRVPAQENAAIDANVTSNIDSTETEAGSVALKTNKADGTRENLQEKEIFVSNFRSSKYNTFTQKMRTFSFSQGGTWPIANGVHELTTSIKGEELFDKFEIQGQSGIKPLIGFKALLGDTYYRNDIHSLIYDSYPINGNITIQERETQEMGVPPVKGIFLGQSDKDRILEESDIQAGSASLPSGHATIVYIQALYYYKDYFELKQQCAEQAYYTTSNDRMNKLIEGRFPSISSGKYDLEMNYVLPGINQVTSTYRVVINLKE